MVITLRYIFHFIHYYGCDIQLNLYHYFDNEDLINRLNQFLTDKTELPNNTFIANWDLFQDSKFTLEQMFQKLKFTHVKEHQDNKILYAQLSFDAQLNIDIDTDTLAIDYLNNFFTNLPQVPLYPSTKYLLYINGISITSKLKFYIHTAISFLLYKKQLNKTIYWHPSI